MSEPIKGFKVFNPDWTCRDKQYTCPGKFEEDVIPSVCNRGMHFCKRAVDCFSYHTFNSNNHVAEVIAYGDVAEQGNKCCTNKLEIVRELTWYEVLNIVNTGKDCTGGCNSGSFNSGCRNSGDFNSGSRNSGDFNSGNYNSGDRNSGYCNSGYNNSGSYNSGNWNSGNYNSGDWNKTNYSNGCFNTVAPKIYLFNKPSKWTYSDWFHSATCRLLAELPTSPEYVKLEDMTDAKKCEHPEAETTGGYLKEFDATARRNKWWHNLSDEEKKAIMSIPNFDKDIFKEITGIDIDG